MDDVCIDSKSLHKFQIKLFSFPLTVLVSVFTSLKTYTTIIVLLSVVFAAAAERTE